MIVLVDQYSASAAEIVAGALQDHDRALVVGVPTYGKGSVQTLFNLSGGNYLKMTTGKWFTPSGRSIQKPAESELEGTDLVLDGRPTGVSIGADGTPLSTDVVSDTAGREQFRTDAGRIVYGGGGIVPDLIVRPDTLIASEREFIQSVSLAGDKYWDTLFRFAVDFNRANPDLRAGFAVTPAMERELFDQIVAEGVAVTWEQLQGAGRLVDLHIGSQIAFAKWGQEGRAQRENLDDNVIRSAIDLLRRSPDQQTLFSMATAAGTAR
jgi:carboxyl-terminal processing protease